MNILITILAFLNGMLFMDLQLTGSVEIEGNMHRSDPMGNVYVVNNNNLVKFDAALRRSADYTNPQLGSIHSIDVSDPLRILLYFRDHNQILWLDNYLSEIRSPLFLDELGIDQSLLVCSASQGGFWVFDGLNAELKYYNSQLQLVHQSMSLNLIMDPDISPVYMIEKNSQVFLNLPGTGILVFDRFGNHSKTLAIEVPGAFQVTDQKLYYFNGRQLFSHDLRYGEIEIVDIPDIENIVHTELQSKSLYLFTKSAFRVYKIVR